MTSTDVRLAFDPRRTYAELEEVRPAGGWRDALVRLAFTALLIGTVVPMAATARVTLRDVALATVSWSFVPVIQLIVGALIITSAPARRVRMPDAIALLFAGHVPWSLWLLTTSAWIALAPAPALGFSWMVLSTLVPAVWTSKIISAFCRTVLHATPRGARMRVAAHQAITWTIVVAYISWAGAAWPRVLEIIGR